MIAEPKGASLEEMMRAALDADAGMAQARACVPTCEMQANFQRLISAKVMAAMQRDGWSWSFADDRLMYLTNAYGVSISLCSRMVGRIEVWTISGKDGYLRRCTSAGLQHEVLVAMAKALHLT